MLQNSKRTLHLDRSSFKNGLHFCEDSFLACKACYFRGGCAESCRVYKGFGGGILHQLIPYVDLGWLRHLIKTEAIIVPRSTSCRQSSSIGASDLLNADSSRATLY